MNNNRVCIDCGVTTADRKAKYCGDGRDKDNEHRWEQSDDPRAIQAVVERTKRLGKREGPEGS
jgi:hypothetical protein